MKQFLKLPPTWFILLRQTEWIRLNQKLSIRFSANSPKELIHTGCCMLTGLMSRIVLSIELSILFLDILIRVDFHLGFKVDPKINLYFKEILEDLVKSGEIKLESSYDSLRKHGLPADFKFVLIEQDNAYGIINCQIPRILFLRFAAWSGIISIPEERALQLDSANTIVEQVPILLKQPIEKRISPMIISCIHFFLRIL